jgi:hypothetical protein
MKKAIDKLAVLFNDAVHSGHEELATAIESVIYDLKELSNQPQSIRNLSDGSIHEVFKYIKDSDNRISVYSTTWYGRHIIGEDCEFYNQPQTAVNDQAIDMEDFLRWYQEKDYQPSKFLTGRHINKSYLDSYNVEELIEKYKEDKGNARIS